MVTEGFRFDKRDTQRGIRLRKLLSRWGVMPLAGIPY